MAAWQKRVSAQIICCIWLELRKGSAAPPAPPETGEERDRSNQTGNRDIKPLRGEKMHFTQGSVNIHVIYESSRLFIDDYIEWRVV